MNVVREAFLIYNVFVVLIGTSTAFLFNDADTLSSLCFPQDQFCRCIHHPKFTPNMYAYAEHFEVKCFEQNLTIFPDFSNMNNQLILHYKFWLINLTDNALSIIPNGTFSSFIPANDMNGGDRGVELRLERNQIRKIEDGAFIGITNMSIGLYLSDNRISALPSAFQHLQSLTLLTLDGNPIMTFDPAIVHSVSESLWTLAIDYKALVSGLSVLSELSLYTMTIYDITSDYLSQPINPFEFFRNTMQDMLIFRTTLATLPCSLIDGELMEFFFIHNSTNISAERIFDCHPGISSEVLDFEINYCDLIEFPNILDFAPHLLALNLRYNKIRRINEKFIPPHNSVEVINLSNNQLQSIPAVFSRFDHLKFLYIEYNNIANVAPEANIRSLLSLCAIGNPWTQSVISCNDAFSGIYNYIDNLTDITNLP